MMRPGPYVRSTAVMVVALLMAFSSLSAEPPLRPQLLVLEDLPNAEELTTAEDSGIDGKTIHMRPELMNRAVTGMPYDLPYAVVTGGAELTLSARKGNLVAVRETIVLPETLSSSATISFLANHEKELRQMRNLARANPGTLRFTVAIGDRTIVDVPFEEADRGSAALADGVEVIGSSRSVDVKIRDARTIASNGMQPDPECEAACNDTYVECYYVICDQRGDCSYCWRDYQYCVAGCPQICVEPKQVYEYATSWQYSGSTGEYICLQNWYRYIMWSDWESRNVYERTVHCDNTYTDVFKRTETRFAGFCKTFHSYGCIGNMYNPPGNC